MQTLETYERARLEEIRRWRAQAPGFATRSFGKLAEPAVAAVEKLVPSAVLEVALEAALAAGARLADRRSILRRAGVAELADLRAGPLAQCDRLAQQVGRRAALLCGGSGAVFGLVGTVGLIADVPTLLALSFRTIVRTGLCYGEELASESQRLVVAVFALAAANSKQEKQQALGAIDAQAAPDQASWRSGLERVAERELAKDAAAVSLSRLGAQLARKLGWRKAGETLPGVGALVGGAVNAWYVHELARAARHSFALRWLQAKYPHQVLVPATCP
jgi:hypothetical protein